MKEIIIDISDDGEIRIETRGFKGNSCVAEAQFIKAGKPKEAVLM